MLATHSAPLNVAQQSVYDLATWRRQVPVLSSYIPLNNCTQAPQTVATRQALDDYLDSWNRHGTDWDVWLEEIRLAKVEFARLIGATPDEIAVCDAYQPLGVREVDVKALEVDFLAGGNLKFLMGIPGIAFLYVRRELIETLEPSMTGWFGRAKPFDFALEPLDWSSTAERFETGTPCIAAAYAARAGMAMLNEIGIPAVASWCDHLSRHVLTGGEARGLTVHGCRDPEHKTPLTAFVCPTDSDTVEEELRRAGVLGSARGPAIRLAPHFYNSPEDIDIALDALTHIFEKANP